MVKILYSAKEKRIGKNIVHLFIFFYVKFHLLNKFTPKTISRDKKWVLVKTQYGVKDKGDLVKIHHGVKGWGKCCASFYFFT